MKIAYNPKTAAVITTATAANDDILFDLNAKKVWAKGIRIGADWADISSKPSSLKNPYALTISLNGTSQGPYDGSAAKNINITPSSIGAATSGHNHDGRYVYNYGGTQMDANSLNKNALGMSSNSGITGDWWHILQAGWNNEYRWNSLIAFPTQNRNGMYYRSGLDNNTAWGDWVKLLDASNSYVNSGKGYINATEITLVNNASKLLTARNLWGNSFDGTKDINGSIIFPNIGDTAISNKISWSGSSDGADIYYLTTGANLGNLVLNVKDDTNEYILLALNGVFKSHFDVANSYWTGRSAQADKWTTARTFTIGNTAKNVDGSGNVSWSLAEIGVRDTWRTVQVNGTSIGNNTLNLCGSTYIGLTNVNGKVTFSLVGSGTTANQAILSNGTANGWTLKTLNIANWDTAYNLRHSHANKSVLDGITSGLVTNWNTAYTFVNTITGTDADNIINKWEEIVNFLAGITEDNKLNTLLNSKLSVYELANNTNVGAIKNNGIYYSTTDVSSGTLVNSPFNTGFALINMTSYDGGDDLRRSRLAFNAHGEIKVSDNRDLANTAETWYDVLTSKNSGISGSTIKLNGTSITVYSSSTADGRYVKKSGDTMSGALNFANNAWNNVGDDVAIGDHNVAGCLGIKGLTAGPGLAFYNSSNTLLSKLVGTANLFLRVSGNNTYNILDNSTTYINDNTITINGTSLTVSKSDHTHNIYAANENYGGFKKAERLPISGFYQSNESESGGNAPWKNWMHLINCLHNNTGNNYALLIAASFYDNNTFKIRVTNSNVDNVWRDIIHSGNIGSQSVYSATKLASARKIWGQSFDGTADITGVMTINPPNISNGGDNTIMFKVYSSTGYKNGFAISSTDNVTRLYAKPFGNGTKNALEIHTYNNTDVNAVIIDATGNVGIGITPPAYKLHVVGDIYTTTGFKKNGSSDSYVLLGGGGHSKITDLSVSNADTVDGYHASGLLTNLSNSNRGISLTVGGTTKSLSNINVGDADTVDGYHISDESRQVYKNHYTVDNPASAWILIKLPAYNAVNEIITISGYGSNRQAHCEVHCGSRFQGIWGYLSDYNGIVVDRIRWKEVDSGKFAIVALINGGITTLTIKATNSLEISKTTEDTKALTITANFFSIGGNFYGKADSATKVIVNLHTANDINYPLVWSNLNNTNNATENQLYKSWLDLYYNPKNKRLFVKGSVNTANINATGTVTSAGFKHSAVTENANLYVLTADGGYTFLNLASNELAHEFSKDITVTSEWADIEDFYGGNLNFLTLPGTYIVLVYYNDNSADGMYEGYFSGIMSWFTGTTNSNNADEIVLHRVGHAYANTIYLRTRESLESETNPYTKLQISANTTLKQHTYKFKFKRIC